MEKCCRSCGNGLVVPSSKNFLYRNIADQENKLKNHKNSDINAKFLSSLIVEDPKENAKTEFVHEGFLDVGSFKSLEDSENYSSTDFESLSSEVECSFGSYRTPQVIVSDHSTTDLSGELGELNLSVESSGDAGESGRGDEYLRMLWTYKNCRRKVSTCSSCSSISIEFEDGYESPCSSWCDTDDSASTKSERKESTQGPSGWRKVRNVVHWSPFIQTYRNQKYRWVQLAGHQGNFRAGEHGTILKKLCKCEDTCFQKLMKDVLRPYVPNYKGEIENSDGKFVQLQDLLADFDNPCVMDIKMGVRTYLEEELAKAKEKTKLRKDMYEKMMQIDPNEPTEEEHKLKAITKPRYMLWRETISSTASLGFRIEGIKKGDGTSSKDFKTTKTKNQVSEEVTKFTTGFPDSISKYVHKLMDIKAVLQKSEFFNSHELIGSSLLFVHDQNNANIWLIDFAKTLPVPEELTVTHDKPWVVGSHEDGYLIGLENLISIFQSLSSS